MSWSARLLLALALVIVGAAAATWALARYQTAARFLGVTPVAPAPAGHEPLTLRPNQLRDAPATPPQVETNTQHLALIEARLARVENATQRAAGSAGRADALLVAFAARRAIERGVALGYLEPLLVNRFGQQHPRAVATIVTTSREPVRLADLVSEYQRLGPELRAGGPTESLWVSFRRELGSLVEVHRADRPSTNPDARYRRALGRLEAGEVDAALAETMRMPGAQRARDWAAKARRYVIVRRALDEIESTALLAGNDPSR